MAINVKNLGYNNYLVDFGTTVLFGGKTQAAQKTVEVGTYDDYVKLLNLVQKGSGEISINCRFKPLGQSGPSSYEVLRGVKVNLMTTGATLLDLQMSFTYRGLAGVSEIVLTFSANDAKTKCNVVGQTGVVPWNS